jgi:hypothetical protein
MRSNTILKEYIKISIKLKGYEKEISSADYR